MNEYKMTEGVLYAVKNSQIVSRKYKLGYVGTEEVLYGHLHASHLGKHKSP